MTALSRLDIQIRKAQAALRELEKRRVKVGQIILDPIRTCPVLEILGPAPFSWVCDELGVDERGQYWVYRSHQYGCELRRTHQERGGTHA